MFPISNPVRIILYAVASICGIVIGSAFSDVWPTFRYLFQNLKTKGEKTGQFPEKVPRSTWIILGVFLFIGLLFGSVASFAPAKEDLPAYMTGDFRVAVAGFSSQGQVAKGLGEAIAQNIKERLEENIKEAEIDFSIVVWGPELAGEVKGSDAAARSQSASTLAEKIQADIVLYGSVKDLGDELEITPEFYVSAKNFYQLEEITGQHNLGEPFNIQNYEDFRDRITANNTLSARAQALAQMVIGMSYLSLQDYPRALEILQSADGIQTWQDEEGKQVLYLLMGTAAVREDDLLQAEQYFKKSLAIEPDYSRALLGLSNIYYRKALLPIENTDDPQTLDVNLIIEAINLLTRAVESPNQPPSSDIGAKYHFELGQNYFMMAYGGFIADFEPALNEFKIVISEYGEGANPRLKDRAAEAHARIGLIYALEGKLDFAVGEYQTALELTADPKRKQIFEDRLNQLTSGETISQE